MRNSLLVKEFCAADVAGLSLIPKIRIGEIYLFSGRGASVLRRSQSVSFRGAIRSENVGMSNRNVNENFTHRKPKVSLAMIIIQGLGGP